jgi:nitrite reductase/ring-hydroxylating ferredoxin subunit
MASEREEQVSGGFPKSWYPLALSTEVSARAVTGKEFLGTRVILYRDASGKALVRGAFCPHLGADLATGEMIEGQLRCSYHHWTFDSAGVCVKIATGDKIPPGAKIVTYPTAEAWGLVWAFHGGDPTFDVPCIPAVDESELVCETQLRGILPIEPWVARSNGVDFQHLRALHGFPVPEPDTVSLGETSLEYRTEKPPGGFLQHGLITGTNTFAQRLRIFGQEMFMMFTGAPLQQGRSTYFSVIGVRRPSSESDADRQDLEARLAKIRQFVDRLYAEDAPILNTIRFRKGVLVAADRHLARFLKYVSEFPHAPVAGA